MFGILSYKVWMIELGFADRLAPVLLRAIQQGNYDAYVKQNREESGHKMAAFYSGMEAIQMNDDDEPRYYAAKARNGEMVAIVPMRGAITKNGDACSWGWRDYQNVLAKVERNPTISAVVLHYNNAPGGTHDGTPEFAHNIATMKKPTVGFADGYAASAHYYALAQSDFIMVNKLTPTELGSIGSYMLHQNVQNMIEAGEIPQMKIIRAPQSTDKVKLNFLEPLTEEIEDETKESLRAITDTFIKDVKSARPGISDEVFTGKMFGMADSIKLGLADGKGALQDAITLAGMMGVSGTKSKRTSGTSQSPSNNAMKFTFLTTIFSGQAWNKVLSAFTEDQAELEATEKKVADMDALVNSLKTENEGHVAKVTGLEKTVSEQKAQIESLQGEKDALTAEKSTLETEKKDLQAKLDAAPAGHATTVVTETDPEAGKEEKSKFHTSVDDEVAKYESASKPKSK